MKPLSPNNASHRITSSIIASILGFVFVVFLLKDNAIWLVFGILSTTVFSIFHITRIYKRTENVFYDSDYMYLKNSYTTRKIHFQNIKRIERTLSDQKILGIQYYEYKIEFVNEFETNDSIHVWINSINNHIPEFEKYLDYYTRNVSVKHTINPFDRYEV